MEPNIAVNPQQILTAICGQVLLGVFVSLVTALFFRPVIRWVDGARLSYGSAYYTILLGNTFCALVVGTMMFGVLPRLSPKDIPLAIGIASFISGVIFSIVISRRHYTSFIRAFLVLILTALYQIAVFGLIIFGGTFVLNLILAKSGN